ncbi:iron ABC transporter permease [Christensenellaceae bacterium OttesenSCG-928-L17]|nr:iron ABC transporter permease [Christensenellaceae bacterium OttesenSCG-928-L17]
MTPFLPPAEQVAAYRQYIKRKWLVLGVLLLLTILVSLLCICAGSSGLSVAEVLEAVFLGGTQESRTIVWNVRMPRVAVGIAVGIALSITGCIMQNVLRNPLASASTLGVSQGASFGAAVAIVYFGAGIQVNAGGASSALALTNPFMVSLFAFLGGIATTAVVLALSRIARATPSTMILAGVALSALFSGATALIQYFADDVMVATVVYWTFGSLGRAGWTEIAIIAVLSLAAFLYFLWNRWNYNAMESGVHTAKSLGVPVDRLMIVSMAVCALVSSVAVAFVGCINFIGLLAPHIVRKFVGNDHRFLIPCSALMGALLVLLADLVSRTIVAPVVLPIGALTSFLGAPLFLYLIVRRGNIK